MRNSLLSPFPEMSPPKVEKVQPDAARLQALDHLQGVERRTEKPVELRGYENVALGQLGEQGAAYGALGNRDRARHAFLDHEPVEREPVHVRIAFDLAALHVETLAFIGLLRRRDSSVMNVAIATVAKDVGTTVTGIQTAITLYTLVMASLVITGGKIGQLIGRKHAFAIGCVIYGCGSFTTSIAPSLGVLLFGWSLLEGIGAALILPAIVGLVASNFGRGGSSSPRTVSSPRPARSPSPRDR